ncbi:hypothetical protein Lalb_Chr10g0101911 [Lupinus albus]|uniref:Uncharacterized protein n=1 Tax=Lupinus albus TaxID=3870 RepID=A0A6A4PWM4_LUPAL|nr:hypothetical protein Lalb_Chr10g0101911 [Lupinus albus]
MRGVGGPLLCIGDLLSDVGEERETAVSDTLRHQSLPSDLNNSPSVPDLTFLFQENYDHLNSALSGTDHSWTSLTLKLCTALETANQLIQTTNRNAASLLDKVGELQKIVKRGDSAIAAARAVYVAPEKDSGALTDNEGFKNSRS